MEYKPRDDEFAEYYKKYISLVPETDIINYLDEQNKRMFSSLSAVNENKSLFRYAENKWSIREVLGHMTDTERIFAYRALRISRGDLQHLLSFDENQFITESNYHNIEFKILLNEFSLLRSSNVLMIKGFKKDMWTKVGTASNNSVSVRALVYIMAGHVEHHMNILKERYGC